MRVYQVCIFLSTYYTPLGLLEILLVGGRGGRLEEEAGSWRRGVWGPLERVGRGQVSLMPPGRLSSASNIY